MRQLNGVRGWSCVNRRHLQRNHLVLWYRFKGEKTHSYNLVIAAKQATNPSILREVKQVEQSFCSWTLWELKRTSMFEVQQYLKMVHRAKPLLILVLAFPNELTSPFAGL